MLFLRAIGFLNDFFTYGKSEAVEADSIPFVSSGMGDEVPNYIVDESQGVMQTLYQNPMFLYVAIACFAIFTIVLCVSLWRLWENKTPKL